MYETYKNQVVSNFSTMDINLKEEQINKILTSMDKAANNFNFYEKNLTANFARGVILFSIIYYKCVNLIGGNTNANKNKYIVSTYILIKILKYFMEGEEYEYN